MVNHISPIEMAKLLIEAHVSHNICISTLINQTLAFDADRVARGDSVWQLRSAFAILAMQSGFALLETGCVKAKNVVNLKVKNIADVAMGGLSYWLFGYALSFGDPASWFSGYGTFAPNIVDSSRNGVLMTHYFYQFSLASSATTIVSGAAAERMRLSAYTSYSFLSTIVYCLPASWVWNKPHGFLYSRGYYDFAGTSVVHGNGGVSALVAAIMIGPRMHRWERPKEFGMTSPVTALTGTLLLWWAWFAFNCGSTLGSIGEDGHLWKINALVAVNTLNGSVGGACFGLFASMLLKRGCVDVTWLISSILGGLVAITGVCSVTSPLECLVIGAVGAAIAIATAPLLEHFKVDDPVGAVPVHFFAAVWGTLSIGLFGKNDEFGTLGRDGLFHGGGFYLLGVQALGLVCICLWSASTTFVFLYLIDKAIGIRMSPEEEELGADICEHGIDRADGLRGMVAKEFDDNESLVKMYTDELRKRSKSMAVMNGNVFSASSSRNGVGEREEPDGKVFSVEQSRPGSAKSNGVANGAVGNGRIPSARARHVGVKVRSSFSIPSRLKSARVKTGVSRPGSGSVAGGNSLANSTLRNIGSMPLPNLPEVTH